MISHNLIKVCSALSYNVVYGTEEYVHQLVFFSNALEQYLTATLNRLPLEVKIINSKGTLQ
jgi:hypothetical protein